MAIRSGAGTGVVVSLVVFVITTILLLVVTIAFYGKFTKEQKAAADAKAALQVFITDQERNSDRFKEIEAAARTQRNVSVVRHLKNEMEGMAQYVNGDPNSDLAVLKKNFESSVGENGVIRTAMADLHRTLQNREAELLAANNRLNDMSNQLSEKDAQMDEMRRAHEEELMGVQAQVDDLSSAAEEYRVRVEGLAQQLEQDREELRAQYEGQVANLENDIDQISRDNVVLISRLDELESRLSAERVKPQNPATLVDAEIIDTIRGADQVFISRGRRHHITRGMTFEVYDDPGSIRIDARTGEYPRGKASLQVIEVGDTTSTCKITRSVPGRPVVRGNVCVNGVYDPDYRFLFLVHGKYDVDLDGRATEAEAEFLRSLVVEWGGEVIIGDELPGNLDFLVMGETPPSPIPPPPDAPDHVVDDWLRKRLAHDKYLELLNQAQDAQIPVLSANRFLILIGHVQR